MDCQTHPLYAFIPEALTQLEAAADSTLADYAASFTAQAGTPRAGKAVQDGDDLIHLATRECLRLFDTPRATALRKELEEHYHALTANHHCVDFHPEFFQGDLLFSLACTYAVPLFSCGGIPMNNCAYPRGIVLGRSVNPADCGIHLVRIPIESDKSKRVLVSAHPPFTADNVRKAHRLLAQKPLQEWERSTLSRILHEFYLQPRVVQQRSLADAASVLQAELFAALDPQHCLPPLVALDMQTLCAQLLLRDLQDPHSLLYMMLCEPSLAAAIWQALDGVRACWQTPAPAGQTPRAQQGTLFFWGVDSRGKAFALSPDATFTALTSADGAYALPLTPDSISARLREKQLIPSIFCYLALTALARGLHCVGGVFQTAYLPAMAHGLAAALSSCGEYALAERIVHSCPRPGPCTGLMPLRIADTQPASFPSADAALSAAGAALPVQTSYAAGAVELLAAGGISEQLWSAFAHMPVRHALQVSCPYHYCDLAGPSAQATLQQALVSTANAAPYIPVTPARGVVSCHN